MKREIKFRAWDNIRHKMSENVEHGIDLGIWIDFGTMIDSKTDMIDFDIMQFTGLLDKNGKEIWEGDIVLTTDETGEGEEREFKYEVKYEGGAFYPVCQIPEYLFEIIGNIYENEDLLSL